jgi:hypothetical protein
MRIKISQLRNMAGFVRAFVYDRYLGISVEEKPKSGLGWLGWLGHFWLGLWPLIGMAKNFGPAKTGPASPAHIWAFPQHYWALLCPYIKI